MRGASSGRWAIGIASVVGACGGRTDILSAAPIPESEFPDAAAHASCDNLAPCCGKANVAFDHASCLSIGIGFWQKTLALANRHYDPVAGGACVGMLRRVAASCFGLRADSNTCASDLMTGTVAPGGDCDTGDDCAPPATCAERRNGSGGISGRVCIATPRAREGAPCVGVCQGRLGNFVGECEGGAASGVDGSPPLSIPMCFADDGVFCGTDGICHSQPRVGEACVTGLACVAGAMCNATINECVESSVATPPPVNVALECAEPFGGPIVGPR